MFFSYTDKNETIKSFFFSSRRRHTRLPGDWSSDVCSSDLTATGPSRARFWFGGFADGDGRFAGSGSRRLLGRFLCGRPDQAPGLTFYCLAEFLDVMTGGSEIVDRDFQFFRGRPQILERDLDVIVLSQARADFLDVVERMRERAVGRSHVRDMFAEQFHLTEGLV